MSKVVNLRQARKQKARHAKEIVAEAHRAEHGIAKSAHKRAKVLAEKAAGRLEGHRLEDE
jgi:hypothetical protein